MTRDRFHNLMAELALSRSDQPRELLRETVAWALLGYGVLLAALAACALFALTGVILAIEFDTIPDTLAAGSISLAGFMAAVLVIGCLWMRFKPPQGIELTEEEHPELLRLIHETGRLAGGVRFHKVVLDEEVNAAVLQNPRLGLFGWYRSYLVIGLPLMEMLPREEFRAVLAHEFAHLAGRDGRILAWLHRTRVTWEKIAGRLTASRICPLLPKFVHWFWPRFNARAFLLSRHIELEADRAAAQIVSTAALACGLRRLAIQGQRLEEEFWQPLECTVTGCGALPGDVMERLSVFIGSAVTEETQEHWHTRAMATPGDPADTHPSLAERLVRLGNPPFDLGPLLPSASAAVELLDPDFIIRARRQFSAKWLTEARRARAALRPANAGDAQEARGVRDAWKRISALSRLDGLEKIQPEVVALLERRPDHTGALYLRGCHLAAKGDIQSADFLERAAADPIIAPRAFETLAQFHSRFGDPAAMPGLKERAEQHERELRAALIERSQVQPKDCFLPHDLSPAELERLREVLTAEPVIQRAWLGAKQVNHFPGWKHLVLIVDARWPAFKAVSERMQKQLLERISERCEMDSHVQTLRLDEGTRPLLKAIRRRVADSEVYRRA
ncbi:M48 family metallopeptidase [Haloferula sp. BvORR071]|uniref:M48 family metallopeptidase n=1 Tax=Haloferula sp. BvORR071 TaxID=1396141 RepID=UPI0005531CF5|nr:M48 family metallopeptidase [Haloferula sp. BvORR071]